MRPIIYLLALLLFTACEAPVSEPSPAADGDNVVLYFQPTTRAASVTAFSKLNVQLFDADGSKVFERVKTQLSTDEDFCTMSLRLQAGIYTIVAVGHSSTNSATIKSPQMVQFMASEGEKLTDTFCHCSTVVVEGESSSFTLPMHRATAMLQFCLKDEIVPSEFAYFLMEYTGGSANFNPTTLQGITKSSQSERRIRNSLNIHQAYTFPYMSETCKLNIICTALTSDGTTIRSRTFEDVPVTRNRITTYTGKFFEDGDGEFTQSDFGFVVHTDWDGEEKYTF